MTGPLAKHSETGGLGARMEEANLIKSLGGGFEHGILRLSVQRQNLLGSTAADLPHRQEIPSRRQSSHPFTFTAVSGAS